MTATYTNSPGTVDIDTVRFEIDDKDTDAPLLTDEEIQYCIDASPHILIASANAASAVASKYADQVTSKTVGDLRVNYGQGGISGTYQDMAKSLRARAVRKAGVYVGGVSKADKDAITSNPDRVEDAFTVGMNDYAGTDQTDGVRGIVDF